MAVVYDIKLIKGNKPIQVSGFELELIENSVPVAIVRFPVTTVGIFVKADLKSDLEAYSIVRGFVDRHDRFDISIATRLSDDSTDPNHTGEPIVLDQWVAIGAGAPVLGSKAGNYSMVLAHPSWLASDLFTGHARVLDAKPGSPNDIEDLLSAYTDSMSRILEAAKQYGDNYDDTIAPYCVGSQDIAIKDKQLIDRSIKSLTAAIELIKTGFIWGTELHETNQKLPAYECLKSLPDVKPGSYSDLWLKLTRENADVNVLNLLLAGLTTLGAVVLPTFFRDKLVVTSAAPWKPAALELTARNTSALQIADYSGNKLGGILSAVDLNTVGAELNVYGSSSTAVTRDSVYLGFIPTGFEDRKYITVQPPAWPAHIITGSKPVGAELSATAGDTQEAEDPTELQRAVYLGAVYTCLKQIFMLQYLQEATIVLTTPQFFGSKQSASLDGYLYPGIVIRIENNLEFYVTGVRHTVDLDTRRAFTQISGNYTRTTDLDTEAIFGTLENPLYA
jgi:hypothetical protein